RTNGNQHNSLLRDSNAGFSPMSVSSYFRYNLPMNRKRVWKLPSFILSILTALSIVVTTRLRLHTGRRGIHTPDNIIVVIATTQAIVGIEANLINIIWPSEDNLRIGNPQTLRCNIGSGTG